MDTPDSRLQQAADLLRARSYAPAEALLRELLGERPEDPAALQLLGLALKNTGRLAEARDCTRRSVAIDSSQPHVHNNLGGIHLRLGELEEARACFEEALRLHREYKEAWRNLALAYRRLGDLEKAEQAARHAVSLDKDFAPGLSELGQVLLEQGREEEAVPFLQHAANLGPGVFQTWHNFGAALRACGRHEEAANALGMAVKIEPRSAETHALLGAVFQDMDALEPAKEAFHLATQAAPDHEAAHYALNQLLWMTQDNDAFLKSYEHAEHLLPQSSDLRCAHAETLSFLDRDEEAETVLRKAQAVAPDDIRVTHTLARVLSKCGRNEEAVALHEAAIGAAPANPSLRTAFARTLMRLGDFRAALRQLEACDEAASRTLEIDQEVLALHFTCARQLGMPTADLLYDYGRFTRAIELPVPPGYRSVADFNQALKARLETLHTAKREPIEQTLRGGTQTYGRLFQVDDPVIAALRSSIAQAVDIYMKDLPPLENHPFYTSRPAECRFAGSWSVRLKDGGFHKNHIHTRGWLSSAYYVALPPDMKADGEADEEAKAGWLKFGQPNDLPGSEEPPEHWIRPEEGVLALFPSYMWHGTQAFRSTTPRITVAFDVQSSRPTKGQLGKL